jgi:type IV secretion system protein VirB2
MNHIPTLSQPSEAALPSAVQWIEMTFLGSLATGIAVIAVAFVGLGMLTGRLDWRVGLRTVSGVFILFGAPMIALEMMALARGDQLAAPIQDDAGAAATNPQVPKNVPVADPYAGAGLQQQ